MKIQYILTVYDYREGGLHMRSVRTYRSNSLSWIRNKEGKLARAKRRSPLDRERICNWGTDVFQGGNSESPIRSLTITCNVS